ncbi:hypothetical protein FOC1_g10011269 [Fusarium oxysporum f. sp. cubense race 1]|uniref:Uncharacterized protein n=1 Tax=Fusarium oxysporum f. sp. cubense (strain race 1) TaxID=1229664 RepID=N4UDS0_FUSC1|nr:hypothetical protein FOC1_g10011269 [Fusarium oxysporum f. sp. cubense race 1]
MPAISDLHHRLPESCFHRITINHITSLPGINLTQARKTIRLVDLMAPNIAIKALFMRCPVDRTDVQENNGQSCYNALVKVLMPSRLYAGKENNYSIARSAEASMRGKSRKRQLKDPQRKSVYGGQVPRVSAASFTISCSEEGLNNSTYTSPGHNGTEEMGSLVKDEMTDTYPESNTYAQGRLDGKTETSLVDGLEERTRCLDITFEDQPVEADIEEAYIQGEALTPPEIKFSEDGDMDDNYWTWDQSSQRFRHWDAERGEWLYFPERFD